MNDLQHNGEIPPVRSAQDLVHMEHVSRTYMQSGTPQPVLDRCTLSFAEGRVHVLLGRSGSGKSTLLNLLGGIDAADSGTITVAGRDITSMTESELTLYRRRDIGTVFQFFHLIPTLTVLENVTLPRELDGADLAASRQSALALLQRVGLDDKADSLPETLSGGEQQRVAIVRALAHDPLLVLADEPTGNLDGTTGETVLRLLLELTLDAGKTLIVATHSHDILPYADHVYEVGDGSVREISIDEVLQHEQELQRKTRRKQQELRRS